MGETLGCGHPDKNRACGDCLDEAEAEVEKLLLQKEQAEQKGRDLCQGFGNLLLMAMQMVKHMKDRHELSTCCHDVTPTPAYNLEQAVEGLNRVLSITEKRKCEHNWVDARNKLVQSGEVCPKCGAIRAGNQS